MVKKKAIGLKYDVSINKKCPIHCILLIEIPKLKNVTKSQEDFEKQPRIALRIVFKFISTIINSLTV